MNPIFKEATNSLEKELGIDKARFILSEADKILTDLIKENSNEPKEKMVHTHNKIYPAISLYKALLNNEIKEELALKICDTAITRMALKKASAMKALFKVPGVYKTYPKLFKSVTNKSFSEEAGFKPEFIEASKYRTKFNMTKCLFKDTLEKYDSLALLKSFCHTDDICNEGLHKKLIWNRKKAMGFGDSYCDFDIYIKI